MWCTCRRGVAQANMSARRQATLYLSAAKGRDAAHIDYTDANLEDANKATPTLGDALDLPKSAVYESSPRWEQVSTLVHVLGCGQDQARVSHSVIAFLFG
jgi:hypothetical protein